MTIRTGIRLRPWFTDHLMVPDLSTVSNSCCYMKFNELNKVNVGA